MRALVLIALLLPSAAGAHSWYDNACCHEYDCAPAESVVVLSPEYMAVTTIHGTAIIPAWMERRESKDSQVHACMRPSVEGGKRSMIPLCIYIPGGM